MSLNEGASPPPRPPSPANPPTEDLIRARPLLFESRPLTRVNKRVSQLTSANPPTPAHPDIDLDFSHFTTALSRIQLLLSTTTREISRYNTEKTSITLLASDARTLLTTLRTTLLDAQQEKRNRLEYDDIAGGILEIQGLRPRAEQYQSLTRLGGEIRELERERDEYSQVWAARRAQFEEIVKQLEVMSAQIKEDKEEQDRREGMSEEEEEGEEVDPVPGKGLGVPVGGQQGSTPVPMVEEKEEGEEEESGERMDTS